MKRFIDIKEYMLLTREARRQHLKLEEECIEIGGNSQTCRALLAHSLGTTIGGKLVHACHACNNKKCSNPTHLYWGTPHDNWIDAKECGSWEFLHIRAIAKHGEEGWKKIHRDISSKGGKAGGGRGALNKKEIEVWRLAIEKVDLQKFGWVSKLASEMKCSHTHVRRILRKYFPDIKRLERKSPNVQK